jgi:hypothetical protein
MLHVQPWVVSRPIAPFYMDPCRRVPSHPSAYPRTPTARSNDGLSGRPAAGRLDPVYAASSLPFFAKHSTIKDPHTYVHTLTPMNAHTHILPL